jgi:glycine cleavage system H protein
MNIPANLKYTKSDEWFNPADGAIGLSDFAQSQLSDIVFVEILVAVGDRVEPGKGIASVESVKAAAEVYSPVSGKVVAVNTDVSSAPETMNTDPYGKAWLIKVEGADASALMDAAAYEIDSQSRAH